MVIYLINMLMEQGYPIYRAVRDSGLVLPPVSTLAEETTIKTSEFIPCHGIWKPVKLHLSPGFAGMFKKPVLPPTASSSSTAA